MSYVDGFVFCVPAAKLPDYIKMAKKAGKIWMEYGALQYFECQGDDLESPGLLSFNKIAKPKEGEVVLFSFIVFKNRKHRDQVNKKVMADPRLHLLCNPENSPFDPKRMAYGGFKAVVEHATKS
jgi:uncharacterized protein YbaA (DUF1428 family)